MCEFGGCPNEVNRDGLCLKHKLKTIRVDTGDVRRERRGDDVTGGTGTAKYVRDMYETRRAAGLPDPEPANKKAARYVPPAGVNRNKKYRMVNG